MQIWRQNQKMLFTVALCVVLGLLVAYLLEKGLDTVHEKDSALSLADELLACKNQKQYLALLQKHYPEQLKVWDGARQQNERQSRNQRATVELLRDGRLRVVAPPPSPELSQTIGRLMYLPAALVDDSGHAYELVDVKLNAPKDYHVYNSYLVYEYFYRVTPGANPTIAKQFRFFLARRQWVLQLQRARK